MSKKIFLPLAIALMSIGLSGCGMFDGSQTVRNAQRYSGLGANGSTYTMRSKGTYTIVERHRPRPAAINAPQ